MNSSIRRLVLDPVRSYYDKIIIIVALAFLVITTITLYFRSTIKSEELRKARNEEEMLRPLKADVEAVAKNPFAKDRVELSKPRQLAASESNDTLFVPEERVSCMNDKCRKPILSLSEKCPYCGWVRNPVEQSDAPGLSTNSSGIRREQPKKDSDGGGLPDWYEKKYGLNLIDSSDDALDSDGDGYSNLEEFKAGNELKREFNPTSKMSVPPAWWGGKLVVIDAKALEFNLRYMSSMRTDGTNWLHVINEAGGKTHSKRIGEVVNRFKVIGHEEKFVSAVLEGTTSKVNKDVSELVLESPTGVKVVLVKGEPKLQWERSADLYYIPLKNKIAVKEGGEFQIGVYKYRVKDIDASAKKVLISDSTFVMDTGEDREIWLAPASPDVAEQASATSAVKVQDRPAVAGSQEKPVAGKVDQSSIEPFEKK